MAHPKLKLYLTVEELKQQASVLNLLPDKVFEQITSQGIPEALAKYLRKRNKKAI